MLLRMGNNSEKREEIWPVRRENCPRKASEENLTNVEKVKVELGVNIINK